LGLGVTLVQLAQERDERGPLRRRRGRMGRDRRIEITVADKVKVLGPGDAYYFESRVPHRFRNVGSVPCEIVSANSPPTF